jgi:PQQ-dependent dehydrogenase (methanol/ethanol family)
VSGELIWRHYNIPGPGEEGHETWKGDSWKTGGGTAWVYFTHDPDLNLIYYGTSNAAPWGGHTRGNDDVDIGQYTNFGTAAHIALNPDTGELVWHYQMTPSDVWDYDGVNEGVLVDLNIGGTEVPALLKAGRNGFFYVLNRTNGDVISAEHYSLTNWATHVDLETGRPVEAANNEFRPRLDQWARGVCPNLIGAKNWPPMSYSEQTGLVYVPTFNMCMDIVSREQKFEVGNFYVASEFDLSMAAPGKEDALGEYKAWDPVTQKLVWSIEEELPFLGGALTTAGGLLFYGNQSGVLKGVDASSGDILWSFQADSGINAAPVTYEIGGKQYLTVITGRLVGPPSFFGEIGQRVMDASLPGGTMITFELGR